MILYLIRHGNTAANERHLYCGATDLPLSPDGVEKLLQLSYQVPASCRFLTSGMLRTEQTLEILFGPVPHQTDSRFREVNFGIFEMYSYEQLRENADYITWITGDNEANIPPNGESGVQMRRRVIEALGELLSKGQDTVVITHGGTIAIIMDYLFPGEGKNRYTWQPKPGCGYRIEGNSWHPIP